MKKFIIICPACKKKMKISDKSAKYKCPHCGEIYKYNFPKRIFYNTKDIFDGIKQTFSDIKFNIKKKYSDAKATYQYMSQLKKHMKSDPNWSQYRKEQQKMKDVSPKKSFKDFFKRK
ncbi:MAG: hypothetical protein U0M80_09340 [Fusobacterium mortiferum]|jgi:hypothetical protein|uniref:Uncharacterized protein n=1 Tax=Fusobacterium mortiferum ATCC 9817 TaxID=469616 RepID=A0ABN5J6N9_FUSMR|nr:hypothetical protein [Fusobacterium mortiferum]AVQ18207.1 hypothetical protein C4N19_03575 [Fusobacterium mortiferum ATCC 9817]EEO36932.1 hypothetical protein FMAG_02494 [Fusobacterium mortiferum ATCC 9817]